MFLGYAARLPALCRWPPQLSRPCQARSQASALAVIGVNRCTDPLWSALRLSGFPEVAAFEDYDTRTSRGLDQALISTLSSCSWITRKQNLMILGPTGVGKTWMASAFGHHACRLGMTVAFHVTSNLLGSIGYAVLDDSLPKLKAALYKPSLLILEYFGIGEMSPTAA